MNEHMQMSVNKKPSFFTLRSLKMVKYMLQTEGGLEDPTKCPFCLRKPMKPGLKAYLKCTTVHFW